MEIFRERGVILKGKADECQSIKYYMKSIFIPHGFTSLRLQISRFSKNDTQLPIAFFDSSGKMRIFRAPESAKGEYRDEYEITDHSASSGAISGPIPEGEWKLVIYKRRFSENIEIEISVECFREESTEKPAASGFSFPSMVISEKSGWYHGELHVHSEESTGRRSVAATIEAAVNSKLDFLAITDHFTSSHWPLIEKESRKYNLLCLQSMEISGDKGHANIHGIKEWINPLVDDNKELSAFLSLSKPPSMEDIADRVHSMNALFGINHPLSGMVGWQYASFPMEKADIIDIWASPDKDVSLCYPTLFDSYLVQGYRIIGVGSSDSHDPIASSGPWRFGQLYTYVYADSLSRDGIINGIKRGRVYVANGNSKMDMYIRYKSKTYYMGDEIRYDGGEIELSLSIGFNPSGNLFIMISGQLSSVTYINASDDMKTYSFILKGSDIHMINNNFAFIRIEFFEDVVKAKFWGMAHKDSNSMRLLGNPIWLRKGDKK